MLYVGQSRFARDWLGEEGSDLDAFTKTLDVAKDRLPRWPGDRLVVLAEHSSLFYDVMTESLMDQARCRPRASLCAWGCSCTGVS